MRRKSITVISVILILAFAISITFLPNQYADRYHQHLEAENISLLCEHTETNKLCTHLPIIDINTNGKEISASDTDKESQTTATIKLINNKTSKNHLNDIPEIAFQAKMRIRGNSSKYFDKKQYKISIIDENGESDKLSLLGMGKSDDWVLGAPFLDKTLIRNYISYNIFGQIMNYTPNVRFCEGYINGKYQGLYLLTESIQAGDNFIDIKKPENDASYTSYILREDRYSTDAVNISTYTNYTDILTSTIEILYPKSKNITEKQIKYIENDFNEFERSLYSLVYKSEKYGYRSHIDVDSFVDYFIINELSQNYDATLFSTYFYKDLYGKISIGPIWDFNNAYDNYMDYTNKSTGFVLTNRTWYSMLMKDEYFVNRIISRYKELRKTILNKDYILNYIDETIAYLGDAVKRNYEVWGYSFDASKLNGYNKLIPDSRNPKSYEDAVLQLKNFIASRCDWMDKHINDLKELSNENANKKYANNK